MRKSLRVKLLFIAAGLPLLAGCIVERQPRRVVVERPAPRSEVVRERPIAPSPMRAETRSPRPDRAFVWIPGAWDWRGRWVWVAGRWDRPPHRRAVWVGGNWVHRKHGYVWVGGHWR